MSTHSILKGMIAVVALACSAAAMAQPKPLRIVVGYPAGGGLDSSARVVADKLRDKYQVVVENKPGAASMIAAEAVARDTPDGSVILLAPVSVTAIQPFIFSGLRFDPNKDLVPVAELGLFRYGLAINKDLPPKTVEEFVAYARANPGVSFATLGTGSFAQLLGVMFNDSLRAGMTEIPYKGSAPGLADLRGGHVHATFDTNSSLAALHKQGALRVLAVTGQARSELLPDVPTFKETGIQVGELGDARFWYGFFAPKGTPRAVVEQLNRDLADTLRLPDVATRLGPLDISPRPASAAAFATRVQEDTAMWQKIIKANEKKFKQQ